MNFGMAAADLAVFDSAPGQWQNHCMPSDSETVLQILDQIRECGGIAGVNFHQGPDRPARYPTKTILAAVRALADAHEIEGHLELARDLRAMLAEAHPDLPIEIEFPGTRH
jgi:hypothetical protein